MGIRIPLTRTGAVPTLPVVCVARSDPTGGQAATFVHPWTERGDYLNAGEEEGCQEEGFEEEEVRAPGTLGGSRVALAPHFFVCFVLGDAAARPPDPPSASRE